MSISEIAMNFYEACDSGKGWGSCKDYCLEGATFSCQADAIAEISTVEGYADWMQGLMTLMPDGDYELKSFSTDSDRNIVVATAVFTGTHTGEGGPVPPTGKSVAADYVYVMQFEGDKLSHMTKIWNDGHTLKQAGWA